MEHEEIIKMSAVEYQARQKALKELAEAADQMLFISPIGMKCTAQYASWTSLKAAIAQAKLYTDTEG